MHDPNEPTELEAQLLTADLKDFIEAVLREHARFAHLRGAGVALFVALPNMPGAVAFGGNMDLPTAVVQVAHCAAAALHGNGDMGTRERPKGPGLQL